MMGHGLRSATRDQLRVSMVYPGFVDTDMGSAFPVPKASPRQIAERALQGWMRGETSIFPDVFSQMVRETLQTQMNAVWAEPEAVLNRLVSEFSTRADAGR